MVPAGSRRNFAGFMKKIEFSRVKIIYSTIAAVIFVVLLVLFFPGDREYQRIPYDVVFLGDSVYGLCRDETSIAAKLQEKTGLKCYNGGLGGTVLGRADAERRLGYTKDSLSAAGLADSVAEIYKDIVIADAPSYSSGISEFTDEQRKTVVEQLGTSGLVSVEEDGAYSF